MKTITCAQFGGDCDHTMTAATEKEMSDMCWKHVKDAHLAKFKITQDIMKNATPEQKAQSKVYFHKVWESVPEDK